MSVEYNIEVPQGRTKVIPFRVMVLTDPTQEFDPDLNPRIPLDLSTAELQMQVRHSYNPIVTGKQIGRAHV